MTTLEQAMRLKEVGWKNTKAITCEFYYDNYEDAPVSYINDFDNIESAINSGGRIIDGLPDEKEMMEFIKEHIDGFRWFLDDKQWYISFHNPLVLIKHVDLTEVLVQACVAVLKQGEGK